MRCFHRDDNIVAGAFDSSRAGIAEAVLELEGQHVFAGNLRWSLAFGGGAMGVVVSGVEGNLDRASRFLDRELKHSLAAVEVLVRVLTGPAGLGGCGGERGDDRKKEDGERVTKCERDRRVHAAKYEPNRHPFAS